MVQSGEGVVEIVEVAEMQEELPAGTPAEAVANQAEGVILRIFPDRSACTCFTISARMNRNKEPSKPVPVPMRLRRTSE